MREFMTSGRLGRGGFWLRHLIAVPFGLWLVIAMGDWFGTPYDVPFAMALTLFLVSVWGRRLHDRGRSAWFLLVAAIPVVGALYLWVECGFLSAGPRAERFGHTGDVRGDYLTVHQPNPAAPSR